MFGRPTIETTDVNRLPDVVAVVVGDRSGGRRSRRRRSSSHQQGKLRLAIGRLRETIDKRQFDVQSATTVFGSVKQVLKCFNSSRRPKKSSIVSDQATVFNWPAINCFSASIWSLIILLTAVVASRWDQLTTQRCAVTNNYLVMEVTRPVTDCRICRDVTEFLILHDPTREEFARHAYAGRPMVVRGATSNWTAMATFSFDFFKTIYNQVPEAYWSVENECQFFPFKTEFLRLDQAFSMPEHRVWMTDSRAQSWYIGWSNCNPEVASILRQHYARPRFLPADSESSAIDWIFMGYPNQGASMHLDYVQRPSWQAQISGSKSWHLLPPPECEAECRPINITVKKGDIILIDTNQWYHDTVIEPGEMSITIGSEYD